jgi:hypothetical protein
MMIKKLTRKQKELMPVVRDEILHWAIYPTNRPKEVIIKNMEDLYEFSGLKKVPVIVCDSPDDFLREISDFVRSSDWSSVRSLIRLSIESVMSSVDRLLDPLFGSSVGVSVWLYMFSSLGWSSPVSSVFSVDSLIYPSVEKKARSSVSLLVSSYFWAYSFAYYEFWKRIGILDNQELIDKVERLKDIFSDCSYGFLTDKICIVLIKPKVVVDAQLRLYGKK